MKKYIQPIITISELHYETVLMAGSGVTTGSKLGNDYNNTDVTYSRSSNNSWDDED